MIAIQPRKTILKLEYNDTDISGDISGDVESFTYNDRGADSSDSISIKVNAVDDKWINSWLPDKEAVLHPTLCTKNWIVQGDSTPLDCGTLVVDDLSYSAGPCVLTIGAVVSGGIFGDHCSPLSDTTILSSMSVGTDLYSHVKTQLPYALVTAVCTAALYIAFGLIL